MLHRVVRAHWPAFLERYAASAGDVQLLGENAGQKMLKLVQPVRAVRSEARALAEYGGVNVHASRHPWSWLLQRVFGVDVLKCEKCGGRLRIVEIAKKPDDIARVLNERGYARAPPDAEPPVQGQLRLVFR